MSLSGDKYDPLNQWWSIGGGSSEFNWFWEQATAVIFGGDGIRPGDPVWIPPPVHVPDTISEVPQTWEELCALDPELCDPILETRPGRRPDPYPQDVNPDILGDPYDETVTAAQDDSNVTHTLGHLVRGVVDTLVGTAAAQRTSQYAPTAGAAGGTTVVDYTQPTVTVPGGTGVECDGMAWTGAAPPKGYKVVNYCGQGVLRKIRRRRRPRMLSRGDAQDVATIVGLVGKGQMASALINRRGC